MIFICKGNLGGHPSPYLPERSALLLKKVATNHFFDPPTSVNMTRVTTAALTTVTPTIIVNQTV